MESLSWDEYGLPIYHQRHIEERSENFLGYVQPERINEPGCVSIAEICSKLVNEFEVPVDFGASLGQTDRGEKVFGEFDFEQRKIRIDRCLDPNQKRFNFIVAHEIGHLVLHRHIQAEARAEILGEIHQDHSSQLGSVRSGERTPKEWMEWQANAFAGALLVPKPALLQLVVTRQKKNNVTRNLGTIYVDWRGQAVAELKAMIAHVSIAFCVSRVTARQRLIATGIVNQEPAPRMRHISEAFFNSR